MKIAENQMVILVGILAAMVSAVFVAYGCPVSLILLAGIGYLVFALREEVKEIGLRSFNKAKHELKKLKDEYKAKKK